MKKTLYAPVLLAASLGSCHRDADSPQPPALAGTWHLTAKQCYCPAGQPLPDETITFDAGQRFQLLRNGVLATAGTYAIGQGPNCSGGPQEPQLTLSASVAGVYVPGGAYTLQGNTLVIDQCSVADGPRYTYTRQ